MKTHAINPLGNLTGCGIKVRGRIERGETKILTKADTRKSIRCSTDWREHEVYRDATNNYCANCLRAMT